MKRFKALYWLAAIVFFCPWAHAQQKDVLYGIGEPLTMSGITADRESGSFAAAEYLLDAMNFGAIREWMHLTDILSSPSEADPVKVRQYAQALDMYKEIGLEITGMSHKWFIIGADGSPLVSDGRMYRRNPSRGSLYIRSLKTIEEAWRTMASLFPQVDQWEVGNEWNTSDFLNVYPEDDVPLTDEERIEIATDMMYYAYRGIKRANPEARVVSFSPAIGMPSFVGKDGNERMIPFTNPGYGIALALSRVYANIASGNFPSGLPTDTDPDHYFDLAAWHPYMFTGMNPKVIRDAYPGQGRFFREEHIDALWQNFNDMAYNVMVMNGDADKKVLLTEMGFCDMGDPEKELTQLDEYRRMFTMISSSMPYVKTVFVFRLRTAPGLGGMQEYGFGLFEKFRPRKKAFVIQSFTGGTKTLDLPKTIKKTR